MSTYLNGQPIGSVVQTEGVYNIDLRIRGAHQGDILQVAEVDEYGRPTAWETIATAVPNNSVTPAKLDRKYLPLTAQNKVQNAILLQEGIHFGVSLPENPVEGQLFFVEEE